MPNVPYTSPEVDKTAFNCPYCQAFANQNWFMTIRETTVYHVTKIKVSECTHCKKSAYWYEERMIMPTMSNAPMPNQDLPKDIKVDYEEARAIVSISPRGSAALLRLAIQKLCKHLGEEGKHIDTDIKNLVKKGLPVPIQQALDIVRVIGNNAVHPGKMDITDDVETATSLFNLINVIAEVMISQPKIIAEMYGNLPQGVRDAIDKRDGVNPLPASQN